MKKILITGANSYIGTSFENYMKQLAEEYSRKYPDDDRYAFVLMNLMANYVAGTEVERVKYLPKLTALAHRLLNTVFREGALLNIIAVCDEDATCGDFLRVVVHHTPHTALIHD